MPAEEQKMARKMKRLSLAKKRAIVRKLSQPGSSARQMADWHRRDGAGPVPEVVKKAVERLRAIPPEIRAKHRLMLSKHND